MLYVGVGDGGSFSSDNAQDITTIFGKILRLDVDAPAPFIPLDNPFVGVTGAAEEIYHLGVRNPWRFTFDRLTGDMYVGDVGRGAVEEVSFIPAGVAGANLGWDCSEGTMCSSFSPCSCGTASMITPIYEYPHDGRCAIIGGYVYRGTEIPSLYGAYLFGDFCTGQVWSMRHDGTEMTELNELTSELNSGAFHLSLPVAFGEDPEGELYVMDKAGSEILKIVSSAVTSYCGTFPNSVGPGAIITADGPTSIVENDLDVRISGLPPIDFGLLFYGPIQAMAPLGDGVLCVGAGAAGLQRVFPVLMANESGIAERTLNFSVLPFVTGLGEVTPGSTWHMQYWYRDPGGPLGGGFNLSDAISITFQL